MESADHYQGELLKGSNQVNKENTNAGCRLRSSPIEEPFQNILFLQAR